MKDVFFVIGPTAVGKSEIAAEAARGCEAEIVSADAFQIYAGLDLLTAKPEAALLRRVPHHLVSAVPLSEEMNAEKFRQRAMASIEEIQARQKPVFVVGGSGMYVKALTDGLSPLPKSNPELRERLNQFSEGELLVRLARLDAAAMRIIDAKNKRRLVRAVEICLSSGRPMSELRNRPPAADVAGVFLFRDRDDLYARINSRVEMMFAHGVVEEVRAAKNVGPTAWQTLGLAQIRELIAGKISQSECIAAIQQATRRYAKRQLTWFRRQTNFESLDLSHHDSVEAIEWIARKARLSFSQLG